VEKKNTLKETNLAYGGQALIEGVMMRGQDGYAFTIKKQDDSFYKEKTDYSPLGKRIKFFGLPFIRGVLGLVENLIIGMKVLNKSAQIAYPEEETTKKGSKLTTVLMVVLSLGFFIVVFKLVPFLLAGVFPVDHNREPFLYNLIAGIFRMLIFLVYLVSMSFLKETKRVFGYHGAEHKTIRAYEDKKDLTVENVKTYSRLHPRCGTSFIFIVFLLTIFIFPLISLFYNTQGWYTDLKQYEALGKIAQQLIQVLTQFFIGLPIVASISYELLKLSGKLQKNPLVKIFIAPGLFFQLFTTQEPNDTMIKAAILSLKMILGEEKPEIERSVNDSFGRGVSLSTVMLLFPLFILSF
jgi:uncharacterized protein YqhQ